VSAKKHKRATKRASPDRRKKLHPDDRVRLYVEHEAHERVIHVEKVASPMVGPVRHDIWDVHCPDSRWWVVSPPTNLYSQADFKSRDVALTFHVGLSLRLSYDADREVPVHPEVAHLLPGSWRRWEQAFEAYDSGDEAEAFQSVGVRLRECLVSFIGETRRDDLVPKAETPPKGADFRAWSELLANYLAAGDGSAKLRSYLKRSAAETWEYVNWLTHAKSAVRMDAEIGLKIVEHLLGVFTAARLRFDVPGTRCAACGSYRVIAGVCEHCDWKDPSYRPPKQRQRSNAERARRLATPCIPSSDISTLIGPRDYEKSRVQRALQRKARSH
jgi:hypothetical protein